MFILLRPDNLIHKKLTNKEIVIVYNEVPRNGHRSCTHPNYAPCLNESK